MTGLPVMLNLIIHTAIYSKIDKYAQTNNERAMRTM